MKRAYQRTWGNKAVLIAGAGSSMIMALIGGSAWYNSAPSTAGFFSKGSVMFFSLLINSINAMGEIPLLYAQRPIVVSPEFDVLKLERTLM
jgi:ABC-type multidrug transport system permease subunit